MIYKLFIFVWLFFFSFINAEISPIHILMHVQEISTLSARTAVNTTMAIAFDGVKPGEAIRQGALNAAVQTVGACIANKIGDLADSKMGTEQIGDITQEIFHGFLGAGIGAGTAAIMGQDIGKGATSGAISAVVGHSTAKISGSKELGNLVAVAVAMMTDQDVGIAYMASNNATTYNYAAHQKQNTEAKDDEKENEEVADGKKVSGRISPSIALNEGIEECTQGILQEQSLREGDLGFTKRVASYLREFKHKSSMNALGEMLYNRQVQKAADRLIDGTAVSSDKNLLATCNII